MHAMSGLKQSEHDIALHREPGKQGAARNTMLLGPGSVHALGRSAVFAATDRLQASQHL
jgi:hypothetical protein